MFSLIIVVITIGLMAAVIATTINYVPMEAQQRQQMFKDADRGIKSLDGAVTRYLDSHRDSDGKINGLVMGDLSATVTPSFGFMPAAVQKEMTWEVTASTLPGTAAPAPAGPAAQAGEAVAICLRPIANSTPMQREVLATLQDRYPDGAVIIGAGCNATENSPNGAYLTYWVPVSHIE